MTTEHATLISEFIDKFGIPLVIAFILFKVVLRLYGELKETQEAAVNELKTKQKKRKRCLTEPLANFLARLMSLLMLITKLVGLNPNFKKSKMT